MSLERLWDKVTELSHKQFGSELIYQDNENHILSVKNGSGEITIIGYYHSNEPAHRIITGYIVDFIQDLLAIKANRWKNAFVLLVSNIYFVNLIHENFKGFPREVKYYYVSSEHDKLSDNSPEIAIRANIRLWRNMSRKEYPPDWESIIMDALERGEADGFGF